MAETQEQAKWQSTWNGIPTAGKVQYLEQRLSRAVTYMGDQRDRNRRRSTLLRLSTIVLSAVATVLLGLQVMGMDQVFRSVAFVLVTLVTLLNALEPFFNYRALWVEQEAAIAQFYRLRDEIGYAVAASAGGELPDATVDELFRDYLQVWERHNEAWIGYRKAGKEVQQLLV